MIKEEAKEVFTTDVVKEKIKVGLGNGRGTLILAIAGTIISLSATFTFCLASIGFDFSQLSESVFWTRWVSMALSTMCVYALVVLHKDEMNHLRKWYMGKKNELNEKAKNAVAEKFEEYLREINLDRRIEWYKRKVNGKIARLNQKLFKVQLKRKKPGVEKRIERLKAKIEKFQHLVSDEYIEANKFTLRTRSKPITSIQVLSDAQRGDDGERNFRSASAYYGGKSVVKVCLSLLMTAAFACVTLTDIVTGFNAASIVMIIMTVLSVVISIVSAILAANGCYKNVYVPNLLFKLKILSDFATWKAKCPDRAYQGDKPTGDLQATTEQKEEKTGE